MRKRLAIDDALALDGTEWTMCDPTRKLCWILPTAREALAEFRAWARARRSELLAIDDDRATIPAYTTENWLLEIPPDRLEG